ncbi:MAG: fibronectin type III domain-containing protein [Myxococcales bacterium]
MTTAARMVRPGCASVLVAVLLFFAAPAARGRTSRTVEFRFTPTARVQLAIWIEKPDGTFMRTIRLTQAVSTFGIGNRPGASQMNSGFRWPYGRRLDVLPVWAHRRAAAPNAAQFKPVVFQHRSSEGCASNAGCGGGDSSLDTYFCLSFRAETTRKAALDAVSCATPFSSDKGRYLTAADVAAGYGEPVEMNGAGMMRPLEATALYPPRRDGRGCGTAAGCLDHPDAADYALHARAVMPDIDVITMATPPGDLEHRVLFTILDDKAQWPDEGDDYVAWIEVNVEGDHNDTFSPDHYGTPRLPTAAWDSWAVEFGYPYRGQPSVVYRVPISVAASGTFTTAMPAGYGDVNGFGPAAGAVKPMDASITDDPVSAVTAGSGADRLRLIPPRDYRVQINVQDREVCKDHGPPAVPGDVVVDVTKETKHTHEWGTLQFTVPVSSGPIDHYEVRYSKVSTDPITPEDPGSFERALPVVAQKTDSESVTVPTGDHAGTTVKVSFGGMEPLTEYTFAIRAVDGCNVAGPYAVAKVSTTRINFTQLSGCFIATAAYGSPLEPQVEALRRARDAVRPRSVLFALATDLYYRSGPAAAVVIGRSDVTRALVRTLIAPAAELAQFATPARLAPPALERR